MVATCQVQFKVKAELTTKVADTSETKAVNAANVTKGTEEATVNSTKNNIYDLIKFKSYDEGLFSLRQSRHHHCPSHRRRKHRYT